MGISIADRGFGIVDFLKLGISIADWGFWISDLLERGFYRNWKSGMWQKEIIWRKA